MKMNAQTVGWLVFLAITKNIYCDTSIFFTLDSTPLTATEGSCIEIQCTVTYNVDTDGAYWFWIKNGEWNHEVLTGTVIYSTDVTERPVSEDFADRVKYIGSSPSSWNSSLATRKKCSILICNLKKNDNGDYAFRFVGKEKWMTKPVVKLEVKENLCPITFEKPPVVHESGTVTLTCSTSESCPSNPRIGNLTTSLSKPLPNNGRVKSTTVSLTVNWNDHGREFSCQTNDKYLSRNISLTVEYAPKGVLANISQNTVVEKQSVTLNCSANGHPEPNYTWVNKRQEVIGRGAVWKINSIKESEGGEYYCEANNKQGTTTSNKVNIIVIYVPEVEVRSVASVVREGNEMTLTCKVKRSNPKPHSYTWFKDERKVHQHHSEKYVVQTVKPEDRGLYKCSASNSVGTASSTAFKIEVEYGPRKTTITVSAKDKSVRVNNSLTFYCNTEANPAPHQFTWYRDNSNKQANSSQWTSKITMNKELHLYPVKRADKACYRCSATNLINTVKDNEPMCIEVIYAPTNLMLSMDTEVREGQLITIRCTVESYPFSTLTLKQTSESNPHSPKLLFTHRDDGSRNILKYSFNVTSTDAGSYTCDASNSEGSKIEEQKLVVEYCPKDVTVKASPAFTVDENKMLTLVCSARSNPRVTSVTWMKMTDGKNEILQKTETFILKSVRPSDRGQYSCEASNDIGTGNSQQTEVNVNYAPRDAKIIKVSEDQWPDGTDSLTLSCSSESYPEVTQYSWYKGEEKVSDHQIHRVYSDQPGAYYCIAQNEIYKISSDPVHLFDRSVMKTLFIIFFVIILAVILLIVVVCRHKRKKSGQQGTPNKPPCFGFLTGWWSSAWRRRRMMNNPDTAEPFRSRDDLLPDQPHRPPNVQRCRPRPDSTPASNIHSVYCTVNLPSGQQGLPAQRIITQHGGHTQDDSLNYASLQFGNKQNAKGAKAEEDVYAKVSKQKPSNEYDERLQDYENGGAARAPMNYDTDSSEDDVQLNYSHVSFKAKPGHQQVGRDFNSEDEDETLYSEVKI
ncbi:B-cell receptor CD22 [Clinocottus analis]|uniref:B-cell receptor CD22 n=1 Tax=Clinocottus analis TaxID=304258 RepID=UPI0035BFC63A